MFDNAQAVVDADCMTSNQNMTEQINQEIARREEINPRTGQPFKRGDFVKTRFGLIARFWGYNRIDGVILIQTQPNSNTWQHSLRVQSLENT